MISHALNYLEKNIHLLYAALGFLTVITLALTLLPSETLSSGNRIFQYDKLGHSLIFGSWTFLLGLIFMVSDRKPLPLLSIFLAGSLFGILIEILQEVLTADRHADPLDAIADIIGCLLAVALLKVITSNSAYHEAADRIPD